MDHLVKFTTAEGREGQHLADTLDDALRFVERLRNAEATSEVRVYRIQEVPISFRAYYKVELAGDGEAAVPAPTDGDGERAVGSSPANGGETAGEVAGRRLFSRT